MKKLFATLLAGLTFFTATVPALAKVDGYNLTIKPQYPVVHLKPYIKPQKPVVHIKPYVKPQKPVVYIKPYVKPVRPAVKLVAKEIRETKALAGRLFLAGYVEEPEFLLDPSILPEDPTEEEAKIIIDEYTQYFEYLFPALQIQEALEVVEDETEFEMDRRHAVGSAQFLANYLTNLEPRFQERVVDEGIYDSVDFIVEGREIAEEYEILFADSEDYLQLYAYLLLAIYDLSEVGMLQDWRGAEGLIMATHLDTLIVVDRTRVSNVENRIDLLETLRDVDASVYRERLEEVAELVEDIQEANEVSKAIFIDAIEEGSEELSKEQYEEMMELFKTVNQKFNHLNADLTYSFITGRVIGS